MIIIEWIRSTIHGAWFWLDTGAFKACNRLSPQEFQAACCMRNAVVNNVITMDDTTCALDNSQHFKCRCDGVNENIDRLVIILRVAKRKEWLFVIILNIARNTAAYFRRSIGLHVNLEFKHLFGNITSDDNRRHDLLVTNPFRGGKQIIWMLR